MPSYHKVLNTKGPPGPPSTVMPLQIPTCRLKSRIFGAPGNVQCVDAQFCTRGQIFGDPHLRYLEAQH